MLQIHRKKNIQTVFNSLTNWECVFTFWPHRGATFLSWYQEIWERAHSHLTDSPLKSMKLKMESKEIHMYACTSRVCVCSLILWGDEPSYVGAEVSGARNSPLINKYLYSARPQLQEETPVCILNTSRHPPTRTHTHTHTQKHKHSLRWNAGCSSAL